MRWPVVIVGGGVAGLRAAITFSRRQIPFLLLEATQSPGGRVQSTFTRAHSNGSGVFCLDRGFQVLQPSYNELRHPDLDLGRPNSPLELKYFYPGARVFFDGKFHALADPWRHPISALASVFGPIGTLSDKVRVGLLQQHILSLGDAVWSGPKQTTIEYLQDWGFSPNLIERFFRPFLGGVFLEDALGTPASFFRFVFQNFAKSPVAVPRFGIGALTRELVQRLPVSSIRLGSEVQSFQEISGGFALGLASGESIETGNILWATEAGPAQKVVGRYISGTGKSQANLESYYHEARALWFASPKIESTGPVLFLDGERRGQINHAAVMSEVSPDYAPPGMSLIALNTLSMTATTESILSHAVDWFGPGVKDWRLLGEDRIRNALPLNFPGPNESDSLATTDRRIFLAGDYTTHPSLEGALLSGRRAAERIVAQITGD